MARFRTGTCSLLAVLQLLACDGQDGDRNEDKNEISFETVKRMQAQGKFARSLELLDKVLEEQPEHAEALYLSGYAYFRMGKNKLATESLKRASRDAKFLSDAGSLAATIHVNRGSFDFALSMTNRILEEFPDHRQAKMQRARARAALKVDLGAGLREIEQVLEQAPDERRAMVTKAALLIAMGRFDEAAVALNPLEAALLAEGKPAPGKNLTIRLCRVRSELAVARQEREPTTGLLGYCLKQAEDRPAFKQAAFEYHSGIGEFERAEAILRSHLEEKPAAKGASVDPAFEQAAFNHYRNTGNLERAEAIRRSHLETQPRDLAARMELVKALLAAGRTSDATDLLVEGVEATLGAGQYQPLLALTEHYAALEEYGQAIDSLERAMRLQDDALLPLRRVSLLVQDGQLELAMSSALELEGQVYVDLGVGRVLLAQGKAREALERLDAGIAVWPENARAHYYAGIAADELGDTDRAIAEFRRTVRADPRATDAAARLERLLGPRENSIPADTPTRDQQPMK